MPLFAYKARDAKGVAVSGSVEAVSQQAVAGDLLKKGFTPIQIVETRESVDVMAKLKGLKVFERKVGLEETIIFTRQMYALTRAGIPIIRAMRGLAESSRSPKLKETLLDVTARLESGVNLATSMQSHPEVFSDLYISMIHVGENTGQLEEAFEQLSLALELERETRKRIKQATRYPIIVVVALLAALFVVNFFVIPKFAGVFAKFGADLPIFTKVLVATSNFFLEYWWLIIGGLIGAVYGFLAWIKTEPGRLKWDEKKMRLPIIGSLFEFISLSRFARNFAMMLSAGMPITHALAVTADSVNNRYIGMHVRTMRTGIERGDSLLRVANATGMFTPLVLQMMAVGEETGQVDKLLLNVADFYDEEVDYGLKRLAESIEPILIFAMGILVLVLALGVFLPIWDLGKAALGK
ncbi:MAG: type II secretion system F family protein [Pseudomonadales bacterium]|uniref:Type II secretory pathway subunit PulF n=1 Tax=Oleiphilus messinensis TaxID=141451 RepID=A0A1Y0I4W1_9GAMM|nr:type II secretion system F family protein [Oleiphilus messinensis]ARU54816.1 type II secretory pathway subunit PulF [Oleiphilus messinensis]MCG8610598.1 type II secretion system F family protein [Pseudomonadales bacterium]